MSPSYVRAAALVAAVFVVAPAVIVLSASAGTVAAEAPYSRAAPRLLQTDAEYSAVTQQTTTFTPELLTPETIRKKLRSLAHSARDAAGGWPQAGLTYRALAAANADALKIADTHVADQAPALLPLPAPVAAEHGPFALSLMVVDNRWGVNLAVSPLPYPDRTACELAGQQWALEIGLSGVVTNGRPFVCIPQVANVSAVLERRRAIATEPRQFP